MSAAGGTGMQAAGVPGSETSGTPGPAKSRGRRFAGGRRKVLLGVVVPVVVAAVLVLALFAYWPTRTPPSNGSGLCVGSADYSGQVVDADGRGLPGVVLDLSPAPPYGGVNATVTSGEVGLWSASLSGQCSYTAQLYWLSRTEGPLLAEVASLKATSTLSAGVSRLTSALAVGQHIALPILAEYPNTPNVTVSVDLPAGLNVSVGVRVQGDIALGFLPRDDFEGYEMTYVLGAPFSAVRTSPFAVFYRGTEVYRIQDASGNWVVYAVPDANATVESVNVTDPWTMEQAIQALRSEGLYPYESVAPGHMTGHAYTVPELASVESDLAVNVFGVSLPVRLGSPRGQSQSYTYGLVNTGNGNACYVTYQRGPGIHVWFYGQVACPLP